MSHPAHVFLSFYIVGGDILNSNHRDHGGYLFIVTHSYILA